MSNAQNMEEREKRRKKHLAKIAGAHDPSDDENVRSKRRVVKLQLAKALCLRMGWWWEGLACVMGNLNLSKGIPTAVCGLDRTGKVNFEFNDGPWFDSLTPGDLAYLIAHEGMHYILMHIGRCGNRNHQIWNWATDLVINHYLDKHLDYTNKAYTSRAQQLATHEKHKKAYDKDSQRLNPLGQEEAFKPKRLLTEGLRYEQSLPPELLAKLKKDPNNAGELEFSAEQVYNYLIDELKDQLNKCEVRQVKKGKTEVKVGDKVRVKATGKVGIVKTVDPLTGAITVEPLQP